MDAVREQLKVTLAEHLESGDIRMSFDKETGVIRIYPKDAGAIARATSGLSEVLELAYTTAEHHPYWGILYHATEICKATLETWDAKLSKDQLSEIGWRSDEIKMMAERLGTD